MQKVLILGAGRVSNPIVQYLLQNDFFVTAADIDLKKAEANINNHPNGKAIAFSVDDQAVLDQLVASHDLTVSLLPWMFHLKVAESCVRFKKHMVTTSYVKPEMQNLDSAAREAGIIILNELGLDPGIDHMSAMRIIDNVHARGGIIDEFYSICGALPAPEAANNPFHYKFSWSPKGVVLASMNDASYKRRGDMVEIPTANLFKNPIKVNFPEVGMLDVYPNRDSVSYIDIYGIPEVQTIMRGTFRFPGWCETLDAIKALGIISQDKFDYTGMSYAQFMAHCIGSENSENIRQQLAAKLGINPEAYALDALEWLGLFSKNLMNRSLDSGFEIVSDMMLEKMELASSERDMVVLQHTFLASYPDETSEVIRSRMLDFGKPGGDTSIARTVALPAAIGVKMILQGNIKLTGIYRPVLPEIYNPILDELENLNIRMEEEYGLPLSENIY
jgi:saccharopine dehydrogenase-like NADP-dependent oxidoreductase